VLTALRDSGLAERTTVLFTADHGEMLGERGLWYKMSFLEQSSRVPLIVHRPSGVGGPARRVSEPVSLVDVAPTLLSLAGVEAGGLQFDGVDLAGSLGGAGPAGVGGAGSAAPGHPVISEYHAEGVRAPSAMVRAGDHKLIVSLEDPDLLYDLGSDPRELADLSGSRPDLVASLRAALAGRPARDRPPRAGQPARAAAGLERAAAGALHVLGLPAAGRRDHAVRPQPRGPVRAAAPGAPGRARHHTAVAAARPAGRPLPGRRSR
jgi:choline-sulfatase